jgi:hypothetical protein
MKLDQETTIKLQSLPDNLLNKVNDYIDFLLMRNKKNPKTKSHLTYTLIIFYFK